MMCYICQRRPIGRDPDKLLCDVCLDKRDAPTHKHNWKPFKFNPNSKITYYDCECGERRMTAGED